MADVTLQDGGEVTYTDPRGITLTVRANKNRGGWTLTVTFRTRGASEFHTIQLPAYVEIRNGETHKVPFTLPKPE